MSIFQARYYIRRISRASRSTKNGKVLKISLVAFYIIQTDFKGPDLYCSLKKLQYCVIFSVLDSCHSGAEIRGKVARSIQI